MLIYACFVAGAEDHVGSVVQNDDGGALEDGVGNWWRAKPRLADDAGVSSIVPSWLV